MGLQQKQVARQRPFFRPPEIDNTKANPCPMPRPRRALGVYPLARFPARLRLAARFRVGFLAFAFSTGAGVGSA